MQKSEQVMIQSRANGIYERTDTAEFIVPTGRAAAVKIIKIDLIFSLL